MFATGRRAAASATAGSPSAMAACTHHALSALSNTPDARSRSRSRRRSRSREPRAKRGEGEGGRGSGAPSRRPERPADPSVSLHLPDHFVRIPHPLRMRGDEVAVPRRREVSADALLAQLLLLLAVGPAAGQPLFAELGHGNSSSRPSAKAREGGCGRMGVGSRVSRRSSLPPRQCAPGAAARCPPQRCAARPAPRPRCSCATRRRGSQGSRAGLARAGPRRRAEPCRSPLCVGRPSGGRARRAQARRRC